MKKIIFPCILFLLTAKEAFPGYFRRALPLAQRSLTTGRSTTNQVDRSSVVTSAYSRPGFRSRYKPETNADLLLSRLRSTQVEPTTTSKALLFNSNLIQPYKSYDYQNTYQNTPPNYQFINTQSWWQRLRNSAFIKAIAGGLAAALGYNAIQQQDAHADESSTDTEESDSIARVIAHADAARPSRVIESDTPESISNATPKKLWYKGLVREDDEANADLVKFLQRFSPPRGVQKEIDAHEQEIASEKLRYFNVRFKNFFVKDDIYRAINAWLMRKCIDQNNLYRLEVPRKYIYNVAGKWMIFAEGIRKKEMQRKFTLEEVKQLATFAEETGYNDWNDDNIIIDADNGKIAIIDTEESALFPEYVAGLASARLLHGLGHLMDEQSQHWLKKRIQETYDPNEHIEYPPSRLLQYNNSGLDLHELSKRLDISNSAIHRRWVWLSYGKTPDPEDEQKIDEWIEAQVRPFAEKQKTFIEKNHIEQGWLWDQID